MNIFKMQRKFWWKHMELILKDVNLNDIAMPKNNCLVLTFLNSYNGKHYGSLSCNQVIKCCIENEALRNEEFAYYILDIYIKKLTKEEVEESLQYYKYGYNVDISKLGNQMLLTVSGNDICIDIICDDIILRTD